MLINPISLLKVFNPYIFNILGDQFGDIIKYINQNKLCSDFYIEKDYIQKKDNQAVLFDKTINEIIFNKSKQSIYERIRRDLNDDNKMCKLARSIDVDNKLFKLNMRHLLCLKHHGVMLITKLNLR